MSFDRALGACMLASIALVACSSRDRAKPAPSAVASGSAAPSAPWEANPLVDAKSIDHVPARLHDFFIDPQKPRRTSFALGTPALDCRFDDAMKSLACRTSGPFIDAAPTAEDWTLIRNAPLPNVLPTEGAEHWMSVDSSNRQLSTYLAPRSAFATEDGGANVLIEEISETVRLFHIARDGKSREVRIPDSARAASSQLVGSWLIWRAKDASGKERHVHVAPVDATGALGAAVVVEHPDAGLAFKHACNHPRGVRVVLGSKESTQVLIQDGPSWTLVDGPPAMLAVDDIDPDVPKRLSRVTCTSAGVILTWGTQRNIAHEHSVLDAHQVTCTSTGCLAAPIATVDLLGIGMFPTAPVVPLGDEILVMWPRQSAGLLMVLAPIAALATARPTRVLAGEWVWPEELIGGDDAAFAIVRPTKDTASVLRIEPTGAVTGIPISITPRPSKAQR